MDKGFDFNNLVSSLFRRGNAFVQQQTRLRPEQLRYLTYVYACLTAGLATTGGAAFVYPVAERVSGRFLLSIFSFLSMIGGSFYFLRPRRAAARSLARGRELALFLAYCVAIGFTYSEFLAVSLLFYREIVERAFFSTVAGFLGLTVASFFASSRATLVTYALASSISSVLLGGLLFNSLFRTSMMSNVLLLGSTVLSSLYVVLDSQRLLHNSRVQDLYPFSDSFHLLTDFVQMFVALLQLYIKLQDEDRRKKRDYRRAR